MEIVEKAMVAMQVAAQETALGALGALLPFACAVFFLYVLIMRDKRR